MSSTYGSTTTTLASAIDTKYLRELIDVAEGRLVAAKFASNQPMQKGEGGTLVYNRILRPSLCNSSATSGTPVAMGSSGIKSLTSNKVTVTPSIFQDVFAIDDDVEVTSFIAMPQHRETIANQMAISLDYQVMKMLATQGMRHRIDASTTENTVSGTCTSGSTTTIVDTAAPFNATYFGSTTPLGYIGITNPDGPNYDHPWKKPSAISGTNTVTTEEWNHANSSSSKYRMVSNYNIATTDIVTTTGLWDVMAIHDKVESPVFDNGYYRGFFDPAQYRDLLKDSVFLASVEYDNSDFLKGYKMARWAGLELLISSNIYREDADTVEYGHGGAGTTGITYISPIFGKDSYALTPWGNGAGKFAVNWHIVDKADSYNTTLAQKTLAWKTYWGGTVLRSTCVVNLLSGATSLNVLF